VNLERVIGIGPFAIRRSRSSMIRSFVSIPRIPIACAACAIAFSAVATARFACLFVVVLRCERCLALCIGVKQNC